MAEHEMQQPPQAEGPNGPSVGTTQPAAAFGASTSHPDETSISTPPAPSVEAPVFPEATTQSLGNTPTVDVKESSVLQTLTPVAPAISTPAAAAPSPTPARTSTPMRGAANDGTPGGPGSRAASAHPADATPAFAMPSEAPLTGAPVRQYLNSKVTGVLLEGMKIVAKEQPKDPLRMLSEFLLQRSKELEGSG